MCQKRPRYSLLTLDRVIDHLWDGTASSREQRLWSDVLSALHIPPTLHCLFSGVPLDECVEHWPATVDMVDGTTRLHATGPQGERVELTGDRDGEDRLRLTQAPPDVELLGLWRGTFPKCEAWSPATIEFDLPRAWQTWEAVGPLRAAAAAGTDDAIRGVIADGGFCVTPEYGRVRRLKLDVVFKSNIGGPVIAELRFLNRDGEPVTLRDPQTDEPLELPRKVIRLATLRQRPPDKHPLRRIVDRLGGSDLSDGGCAWTIPDSLPDVQRAVILLRPLTPEEAFFSAEQLRAIRLEVEEEGVYSVSRLKAKLALSDRDSKLGTGFVLTVRQRCTQLELLAPCVIQSAPDYSGEVYLNIDRHLTSGTESELMSSVGASQVGYVKRIAKRCLVDEFRELHGLTSSHQAFDARDEEATRKRTVRERVELDASNEPFLMDRAVVRPDLAVHLLRKAFARRFVREMIERKRDRVWWRLRRRRGWSCKKIASVFGVRYRTVVAAVRRSDRKLKGLDLEDRQRRRKQRRPRRPDGRAK
jgi:hypothetical protein